MPAKISLLPDVPVQMTPRKGTTASAAVDLRANIDKPFKLMKGQGHQFPTGTHLKLIGNSCGLLVPRSGLSGPPHCLTIVNSPGLIDPDYDGELFVSLFCLGTAITINPGDRIAQLLIVPFEPCQGQFTVGDARTGGLGSTGVE